MAQPCVLYHFAFHPASRAARLALGEARIDWTDTPVRPWEPDCPLGALNPSGMPPVIQTADRGRELTLCELPAILGWVEDQQKSPLLLSADIAERAEARRLTTWFESRFTDEVDAILLHERMEKPLLKLGPPEARALRAGRDALKAHLALLEDMAGARDWLAGAEDLVQQDQIAPVLPSAAVRPLHRRRPGPDLRRPGFLTTRQAAQAFRGSASKRKRATRSAKRSASWLRAWLAAVVCSTMAAFCWVV